MRKPREVAGFQILPIILPASVSSERAQHFLYVKSHDPKIPDEETAQSLFLVNIPVSTTPTHLRHLFGVQLSSGHVQRVEFAEIQKQNAQKSNRKRKRLTAEEIETNLDAYKLPQVVPGEIHTTGASAVVVFIDRASRDLSLRAIRKFKQEIVWGEGITDDRETGLNRYQASKSLQYPPKEQLLRLVEDYMTTYNTLEEARSQENARKRALPDEDGFITVTRGSKGAFKQEEAKQLSEQTKAKAKDRGFEDFYRFQMREKRKAQQNEILQRFEEDKRKIASMSSISRK